MANICKLNETKDLARRLVLLKNRFHTSECTELNPYNQKVEDIMLGCACKNSIIGFVAATLIMLIILSLVLLHYASYVEHT